MGLFGHFSRGDPFCGFSKQRNCRISRKLSSSFVMSLATICDVEITLKRLCANGTGKR